MASAKVEMAKLGLDMKIHVLWYTFCDSNLGNPMQFKSESKSKTKSNSNFAFCYRIISDSYFLFTCVQCGMKCLELSNYWETIVIEVWHKIWIFTMRLGRVLVFQTNQRCKHSTHYDVNVFGKSAMQQKQTM